jgi:SEFIR domain/VHL beta domain
LYQRGNGKDYYCQLLGKADTVQQGRGLGIFPGSIPAETFFDPKYNPPMAKSSRVFVSYSQDSPEHKARVLALATRLVTEGIDAKLDQWLTSGPEGGWQLWTERQIADADFVLLVCTDLYRKRVERPDEVEGGAGAFWEGNIIRKRLYDDKGANRRFIPIFYGASGSASIPEMLEGFSYYQIDAPDGYTALYRRLTDQPEIVRPELGSLVVLPRKDPLDDLAKEASRLAEREIILPAATPFQTLAPLPHCDERQVRSLEGTRRTLLRFDNYLSEDITLYWLNYDGLRVYYSSLGPGRSYVQETFVTHPWVVTKSDISDGQGKCLAIFLPADQPGVAEIK